MILRDGLIAARGQIAFLIGLALAMAFVVYVEQDDGLTDDRAVAIAEVCAEIGGDDDWPQGHPLPSLCR